MSASIERTALKRMAPYLALTIKSVSLAHMTATLMETYLGRDAGQRVLSGRILRGVAEKISSPMSQPRAPMPSP